MGDPLAPAILSGSPKNWNRLPLNLVQVAQPLHDGNLRAQQLDVRGLVLDHRAVGRAPVHADQLDLLIDQILRHLRRKPAKHIVAVDHELQQHNIAGLQGQPIARQALRKGVHIQRPGVALGPGAIRHERLAAKHLQRHLVDGRRAG